MGPLPRAVPGRELAKLRREAGIEQAALAERLGIHRVTLSAWEHAPLVSALRAELYRRAVRQLLEEALREDPLGEEVKA